jgi:hypothetical protein
MSKIQFVVLTDLHLGAENSLLTNLVEGGYQTDNTKPSPVMIQLVQCIREVLNADPSDVKPKLVFNGDLMELALTSMNDASMAFHRFIELAFPEDESKWLFDREIIFLAGNHDHNIWESSRYAQYINLTKSMKPGERIGHLSHATKMFDNPEINCELLTSLIQVYPHLKSKNVMVKAVYPAFAQRNKASGKCVIFSHGHFIEGMYSLMTSIDEMLFPERQKPDSLDDLEEQNFAWIDFFWSTMGRSGIVGKDVQLLYDKMQDENEVERIIETFAKHIALKNRSKLLGWIEWNVLKEVMHLTIARQAKKERNQNGILSGDCMAGLKKYMEVYILNQLEFELQSDLPSDVTFLFGHTHKPFQQYMDFEGYNGKVRVINSGGWVVDTTDLMSFHGGSVLFVDDNLDTAILSMYKEGRYKPCFETLQHGDHQDKTELEEMLSKSIDFNQAPWINFESEAQVEVNLRYKYLKEIIKSNAL